jgi:nitroreductase
MEEISLTEALYTTRAMRRLRPDPVSEEDLRFVIDAATQAPSGENAQSWAFVVVRDPELRRRIGRIYRSLGEEHIRRGGLERGGLDEETARIYRDALGLAERLAAAPVLILACMRTPAPRDPVRAASWYGSIFPAVQNLLLAARARGLGATLTTLHKAREAEIKEILGIPEDVTTVALVPLGHPEGSFRRPRRRPSWEVTHWDHWGRRAQAPGSTSSGR